MESNGTKLWMTAIIVLVIGLAAGYLGGNYQGERAAEAQFMPLIDGAFPPPPDVINALSGTVRSIYGATIALEVRDPSDYLPRLDGSPRRTVTRKAQVSSATIYVFMDYSRLDREGNPVRTSFTLADLKPGDKIMVRSNENIKNAETFDITSVERVAY